MSIDFAGLGLDTAHLCIDVPVVRFMLGPLNVVKPERKPKPAGQAAAVKTKKQAPADARAAAGEAEMVGPQDEVEKRAEALNSRRSTELYNEIKALMSGPQCVRVKCADGVERRVLPLLTTLVDPWSYSQTVENLFYFSSSVKKGFAGLFMAAAPGRGGGGARGGKGGAAAAAGGSDDEGEGGDGGDEPLLPYITVLNADELDFAKEDAPADDDEAPGSGGKRRTASRGKEAARERVAKALIDRSHQLVIHIDVDSWRGVVKKHGLKSPALAHRLSRDSTAPLGFRFKVDEADKAAAGGGGGGGGKKAAKGKKAAAAAAAAAAEEEEEADGQRTEDVATPPLKKQ